jgi:phosphohistidine phosphatase SixA
MGDGDKTRYPARMRGWALYRVFALWLFLPLLLLAASSWVTASPAAPSTQSVLGAVPDGSVILFRHAVAPGGGDPVGFRLGDCATQRNLDTQGREQARRIGEQLRRAGVSVSTVWTSQWCRTRETAALAFPGQRVVDQPAFNSFFDDRSKAHEQTARARALLQAWRGPGVLVVTTHQVNITALTGISPSSGEGIVVRVAHDGLLVMGRIPPPTGPVL